MSYCKVLIVTNMYPSIEKKYSGIFVKNQYQMLKSISDKDIDFDIFYMKRTFTNKLKSLLKYLKAFVGFIPVLFKKYTVIHLHYFFPLIILVWIYKLLHPKTKLIVTFHGSDINLQVNDSNKKLMRFFARKIDLPIAVGKQVNKNIEEKLGLKNAVILPVGVNDKVFYVLKNRIPEYDFIFVGSFFEVKGIDILYKTICDSSKDIKFCVVGKGMPYESKFKTLSEKGYNVTLKVDQSHDQLRELYNQSKFLFAPSRSEGFPTVTMEAMYCGVPVITSNIPQFKEQVKDSINGFTFDLNATEVLPQFLTEQLNMPLNQYNDLAEGAFNSLREFSLTQVCERLIKIYKS